MATQRLIRSLLLFILAFAGPSWASEAPARMRAFSPLEVNDEVHGDVFTLAADVKLGPGAHVHGHVIALLGHVEVAPGAEVDGRVIAVKSIASMSLQPASQPGTSRLDAAVRLLSSGGWLLVATAIASIFPRRTRAGTDAVLELPLRALALGATVMLTLFVALVAVLGFNPALSMPLAAAVLVAFFGLKAAGLTVVGAAFGSRLLRLVSRRNLPLTWPVFVGVAAMLLLRMLPWVGGALWTLASVIALGAGIFALAFDRGVPPELA